MSGGRPPLGANKRRRSVLVKLTDREHAAVKRRVRELVERGKSATLAGWFRERGLRGLVSP